MSGGVMRACPFPDCPDPSSPETTLKTDRDGRALAECGGCGRSYRP